MITNKEIQAVELSPTKRDFYQLWNELLETASKLSERWDPSATNESDPGIVLLKVLTAVAEKLNYTIDKNILEAFMPSATQEAAMRALCEMLGYEMKYYQSAVTEATITYTGGEDLSDSNYILIPKGTYITNTDEDIIYFTLHDLYFRDTITAKSVDIMEGQWEKCETDSGDKITVDNLDDQHRYYLPETQIAENGIFIYNYGNYSGTGFIDNAATEWQRVTNLNSHVNGSLIYKFGYDSKNNLPYIQFPEDVSTLITDGLLIYYVRTNGINGNVSYAHLNKFQSIDDIDNASADVENREISEDTLIVKNIAAATNGNNMETLNDAYTGYKKTIGTFDTLVTCRDYMNKIYMLTESETSSQPLVSNIIVSDIRDDINRSYKIASFNELGPTTNIVAKEKDGQTLINAFDLILYPFKALSGLNTINEYKKSFTYNNSKLSEIIANIEENKTLSHNIVEPDKDDIACIKNVLRIKATISTYNKVNLFEEKQILNNVYKNIYATFNMRKLEFGEAIPTDAILECIKEADTRIKEVYSDGPAIVTTICTVDDHEYVLDFEEMYKSNPTAEFVKSYEKYRELIIRNVLAGRIPLWNYDTRFKAELGEQTYGHDYEDIYEKTTDETYPDISYVYGAIESKFEPTLTLGEGGTINNGSGKTLLSNEVIKFRAPNFATTQTYSAYINYYFDKETTSGTKTNIPATLQLLQLYLVGTTNKSLTKIDLNSQPEQMWDVLTEYLLDNAANSLTKITNFSTLKTKTLSNYPAYQKQANNTYKKLTQTEYDALRTNGGTGEVIYPKFVNVTDFTTYIAWLTSKEDAENTSEPLRGLYSYIRTDRTRAPGYLIDVNCSLYKLATSFTTNFGDEEVGFTKYYVQELHDADTTDHTKDGLGQDAELGHIPVNSEYKLVGQDKLFFNYTKTVTDEAGNESSSVINKEFAAGTIIRPNFKLKDSFEMNQLEGTKFTKTTGFNFDSAQLDGMFALGSNEQIEIREPVEVNIGNSSQTEYVNFYWNRNDDNNPANYQSPNSDGLHEVRFIFDEDNGTAYTLKTGEYFYFTDKNKLDIAYYGPGTKIIKIGEWELTKYETETGLSAETINQEGLSAAIPWKQYGLRTGKSLKIKEYQYITLTENDTLKTLQLDDGENDEPIKLTSQYEAIANATYVIDDGDSDAANDEIKTLPTINVEGASWEIASFLDINIRPDAAQTLHTDDKLILKSYKVEYDRGTGTYSTTRNASGDVELYVKTTTDPALSIKSNYTAQSPTGTVNTFVRAYNADGELTDCTDDFAVRLFEAIAVSKQKSGDLTENEPQDININNFGEHWTKITFSSEMNRLVVPIAIPKDDFGLLTYYYVPDENATSSTLTISLKSGGAYSYLGSNPNVHTLKLTNGANTNKFSGLIFEATAGQLILGELNLVYTEKEINPQLGLKETTFEALTWLPNNKDFYYDMPMSNATAIDTYALDEDLVMMDPKSWYDVNNINNKFVISHIDADYIESSSGITIAGSCKR